MKILARLAIVAALAFAPMAARADLKAIEAAAKKEGELTWYIAHYTSEGAEDLGRGFTEMTGIKVNVVRTTAQVAYQRLLQDIRGFVATWLPSYMRDNRSYLTVAIGCTGGRHRSVYFAEALARSFRDSAQVLARHRGLSS